MSRKKVDISFLGAILPLMTNPIDALHEAARRAGNRTKLAEICLVSKQAANAWTQLPARHCLAVEAATGVSRYDLRPDIYGENPGEAA